MLFGEGATDLLKTKKVAVFGVGGVGGYCVEALVRSGIGSLELIDSDKVSLSNVNRQIIATEKNVGVYKTTAAANRAREINGEVEIVERKIFYTPENADSIDFKSFDYVVDAIDTISSKISVIENCYRLGVPVISSMGCGNKIRPDMFKVADIYQTQVCPLAKVMRRELKKRGVLKLKTVYSEETPRTPYFQPPDGSQIKQTPSSCAFVPSVAGLIIGGEVVKDLLGLE